MVHINHSGEGLANWFTTEAKANYSNDLFNAAGTGLQTQIRAITNAGDQAVFQGSSGFRARRHGQRRLDGRLHEPLQRHDGAAQERLTNDVRFGFAIIDANPSPDFDDDLAASGRTREMVDTLRTNQINLCSTPPGAYVDTRGYTRTDLWHLT